MSHREVIEGKARSDHESVRNALRLLHYGRDALAELAREHYRTCLVCDYPLTLGQPDFCFCCTGVCPCRGPIPDISASC